MYEVDEKVINSGDIQQFERLLIQISQLTNTFISIRNLQGEVIFYVPNNPIRGLCSNQGSVPTRCKTESFNLSEKIEISGKPVVQKCYENVDIIGLPLRCQQNVSAILFACKNTDNGKISNNEEALLEEIANLISSKMQSYVEMESIAVELSDKYEELTLIYTIGETLSGNTSVRETIDFVVSESREIIDADMVFASIPEDNILATSSNYIDLLHIDIAGTSLKEMLDRIILERFADNTHPAYIVYNDVSEDTQLARLFDNPMGLLAVPVTLKGMVNGYLCILIFGSNTFIQNGDLKLAISLARQISMALTNAALYQDLKDFLLNVIKTLVSSIEAKDSYTKGHSERVNTLTMLMASNMELQPEEIEEIHWASMLHDIGKIGVPEEILTKAEKLTEDEFIQIEEHPERGYSILKPIEQLKGSISAIRHHHEKFDGTGYPLGLKGKEIPRSARIIAVADTYDAMTSTRSYRLAMKHEVAISELARVRGTQLDPEIVDLFLKLMEGLKQK